MPMNDDWEPIGKALSNIPTPPPSERFVQGVMSQIRQTQKTREGEESKIPWWNLWKIPALGFGFATVLFAVLTAAWGPSVSIESYLLADIQDPMVSRWLYQADASKSPAPDEVLQFALEKSEDKSEDESGGDL